MSFTLLPPPPRPSSSSSSSRHNPPPSNDALSDLLGDLDVGSSGHAPSGQQGTSASLFHSTQAADLLSDTDYLTSTINSNARPIAAAEPPTASSRRAQEDTSFGSFTEATHVAEPLGAADLLNFDDDQPPSSSHPIASSARRRTEARRQNLLGEIDDLVDFEETHQHLRASNDRYQSTLIDIPDSHASSSSHHHVRRHPPRRMSQIQSFAGPSSPPAVSSAMGGGLIDFEDFQHFDDDAAHQRNDRIPSHLLEHVEEQQGRSRLSTSPVRRLSLNLLHGGPGQVGQFPRKKTTRSPQNSLARSNTFPEAAGTGDDEEGYMGGSSNSASMSGVTSRRSSASAQGQHPPESQPSAIGGGGAGGLRKLGLSLGAKAGQGIKSRWKTVMGPSTFQPAMSAGGGLDIFGDDAAAARSPTSMPIEVSHQTPFFRNDPYAFSSSAAAYVPPTGAPGFDGRERAQRQWREDHRQATTSGSSSGNEDWSGTRLVGRRDTTHGVLDEHGADQLRGYLPARQRLSNKWTLLFSLDQHGASLTTLYGLTELYETKHPQSGNLLIIRDAHDRRFGAYLNEGIKRVAGSYFGSGESWLFRLNDDDNDKRPSVYKWTGRNDYFALCESDFISFGGGDGKYGLYLDKVLTNGSSASSPAYNNAVLCIDDGDGAEFARFQCIGMEVWATSS